MKTDPKTEVGSARKTARSAGAAAPPPPAPDPWLRRIGRALLLVHLIVSPLIFSAKTVEVFEYNKVAAMTIAAILLLGGALALAADRWIRAEPSEQPLATRARELAREPIALGMILFFASALLSTAISISPRTSFYGAHESFAGIITMAAYLVLFFATRSLCKDAASYRLILLGTLVGVAGASVYGVMQLTGLDRIQWGRTSGFGAITRVFGTMGHPNFFAAFLLMGFPVVVHFAARAFQARVWLVGAALALTAALAEVMVAISISRGAWGGLAVAFAALLLGWWIFASAKRTVGWTIALNFGLVALLLLALTTFPAGRAVLESMGLRFQYMLDTTAITRESRRYIWECALQMFRDSPLVGVGLDGFQLAFEHYRTVAYWIAEWNGTPTKAHNEALHILSTQGLFGAGATLMIIVGSGVAFVRALARPAADRLLLVTALAGVAGFLVQNLFSFTVAGCGTLFITFTALLSRLGAPAPLEAVPDGPAPSRARRSVPPQTRLTSLGAQAAILIAAGVAIYPVVYVPYQANSNCRIGATLLGRNPGASVAFLKEAVRLDPSKELYWVRLGTANQLAARQESSPQVRRALLVEARKAYQRSIDLVPANSYNHANLGRLLGDMAKEVPPLARKEEAYKAFEDALALDPNNGYFYADGANCALSFGDLARTETWAKAALDRYPEFGPPRSQLGYLALMEATMLQRTGKDEASIGRFREAAGLLADSLAENKKWHGDESGRTIAGSNLAAALIRAGEFEKAIAAAEAALAGSPDYTDARFNLAKACEMAGRLDRAHAEYVRVLEAKLDHGMARQMLVELRERLKQLRVPLPPLPKAIESSLKPAPGSPGAAPGAPSPHGP